MASSSYNQGTTASSGISTGQGYGENTSESNYNAAAIQTPQSEYELQLSQLMNEMGQNQYQWGQTQFNNAAGVTDQAINNNLQVANYGMNQAANLQGRYQNIYEPLSNQYIQEAGTYASTPRIQYNMGQAQSAAAQANQAGQNNAIQQLQSYGIDPSSGRYQELEQASNAQGAAAEAAAGQQAQTTTQGVGRQMLQTAVAQGQSLPGEEVNALNSAYQGVQGAENDVLGLENTGVALEQAGDPAESTAMSMKLPSTGTSGSSYSQGMNENTKSATNSSYGQHTGSSYGTGGSGSSSAGQYASSYPNALGGNTQSGTYSGNYARGGEAGQGVIPGRPTTGGFVPRSASPSGGAQTDDIPARLNAREFVIPQDVADWKGQEFFQKLIDQSRKARQTQTVAQGQMKPSLAHMQPRFVSRHMGASQSFAGGGSSYGADTGTSSFAGSSPSGGTPDAGAGTDAWSGGPSSSSSSGSSSSAGGIPSSSSGRYSTPAGSMPTTLSGLAGSAQPPSAANPAGTASGGANGGYGTPSNTTLSGLQALQSGFGQYLARGGPVIPPQRTFYGR